MRLLSSINRKLYLFLMLIIMVILLYNLKERLNSKQIRIETEIEYKKEELLIGSHVNIIDPDDQNLDRNFSCIKTKKVLDLFSTTICLHGSGDTVSNSVANSHIWEEVEMTRLLKILILNPDMDMIDIGANIGGYTMFTAGALGRFTLAVDCFKGNIEKIARAVQLQKVQHRVVLIQNAIYFKSNENLIIENDDPSGIRLSNDSFRITKQKFQAKTITFDDLYPILEKHRVKKALIKIDIETSESYMCQTGEKIFKLIDIPFIMMEWHSWRINHQPRYLFIIDFFTKRNYYPTNEQCQPLQISDWLNNWPGNIFWIKQIYSNQTFC